MQRGLLILAPTIFLGTQMLLIIRLWKSGSRDGLNWWFYLGSRRLGLKMWVHIIICDSLHGLLVPAFFSLSVIPSSTCPNDLHWTQLFDLNVNRSTILEWIIALPSVIAAHFRWYLSLSSCTTNTTVTLLLVDWLIGIEWVIERILSLLLVQWVLIPDVDLLCLWQACLLLIGPFHDLSLLRNRGLRSVEILRHACLVLRLFLLNLDISTACACVVFPLKFSSLYPNVHEWILSDPRIPLLHLILAPPNSCLSRTKHYLLLLLLLLRQLLIWWGPEIEIASTRCCVVLLILSRILLRESIILLLFP